MRKGIFALAALAMASPAMAAPVYLDCRLRAGSDDGGAPELLWHITLNEETGTVSWTIPESDVADTARAVFTADEVRWNSLTINRTTLAFTRRFSWPSGQPLTTHGRCQLVRRPSRQF